MKSKNNLTVRITVTAVLTAMTVLLSSFYIPVPGGHLYLCDVAICFAAILLSPAESFVVGGIGSFLGDLMFYPASMFVSLVVHGLQAVIISLISHKALKKHPLAAIITGLVTGGIISVTGFTLGKMFIYSTVEYAVIKLPYEILQAVTGAAAGTLLYKKLGSLNVFGKLGIK